MSKIGILVLLIVMLCLPLGLNTYILSRINGSYIHVLALSVGTPLRVTHDCILCLWHVYDLPPANAPPADTAVYAVDARKKKGDQHQCRTNLDICKVGTLRGRGTSARTYGASQQHSAFPGYANTLDC